MLLTGALVLSACTGAEQTSVAPSADEMQQSFVESGLHERVASCVVGWFDRFDLSPQLATADFSPPDQLVVDEAIENCVVADELVNPAVTEPEALAFDDEPHVYGDDLGLDLLWGQCEAGDGRACDVLWERAPIGSDYEEFGVTCGRRFEILDCASELNSAN